MSARSCGAGAVLAGVALIAAATAQEPDAGAGGLDPVRLDALHFERGQLERIGALARRVADLPRSEPGAWQGRWESIELLDDELRAEYGRALGAYRDGDLARALARCYDLLRTAPDFPAALHLVGVTCFRLRRYGDGAEAFERLLLHAPGAVGRTRALGHCYYELGRYDAARDHYQAVLAERPESVEARFGLALSEMRAGDVAAAMGHLDGVLARDGAHAEAAYWRARLAFEDGVGSARERVAWALRARDLAAFEPRPWFLVAEVLQEEGRDEPARFARERFRALDRVAQAVRALEGELVLDPCAVEVLEELASLRESVGDRSRAAEAWRRIERCHLAGRRDEEARRARERAEGLDGR